MSVSDLRPRLTIIRSASTITLVGPAIRSSTSVSGSAAAFFPLPLHGLERVVDCSSRYIGSDDDDVNAAIWCILALCRQIKRDGWKNPPKQLVQEIWKRSQSARRRSDGYQQFTVEAGAEQIGFRRKSERVMDA